MTTEMHNQYQLALEDYLTTGSEENLTEAYRLGRDALASEHGLLKAIDIHHAAMADINVSGSPRAHESQILIAAKFLKEYLSPFEMLHQQSNESNAALRRLNDILEENAKRIAHTLHDQSAELLGTVYLELAELARESSPTIRAQTDHIAGLLDKFSKDLRNLSHDLRPPIIDQLGLLPALRSLAQNTIRRTGLDITVVGMDGERAQPSVEITVYRTVQEALTNVVRHAGATTVQIHLWGNSDTMRCSVTDDGNGFDLERCTHGLGLICMQERIKALTGTVEIESTPGRGTTIDLTVPLSVVS
jgi:signal transduction histidine kinase